MLTERLKFLGYWVIGLSVFVSTTYCYCQEVIGHEVEETETDGCYVTVKPACINVVGEPVIPANPCREIKCDNTSYQDVHGNTYWSPRCPRDEVQYSKADTYSDTIGREILGLKKGNTKEIDMQDKYCGDLSSCWCRLLPGGLPPESCKEINTILRRDNFPVKQKQADATSPLCPNNENVGGNEGGGDVEVDDLSSMLLRPIGISCPTAAWTDSSAV